VPDLLNETFAGGVNTPAANWLRLFECLNENQAAVGFYPGNFSRRSFAPFHWRTSTFPEFRKRGNVQPLSVTLGLPFDRETQSIYGAMICRAAGSSLRKSSGLVVAEERSRCEGVRISLAELA